MRRIFLALGLLALLSACSDTKSEPSAPKSEQQARKDRNGSLAGEGGGINILGGSRAEDTGGTSGSPIGVNSYLWRATLDTLSFMPLVSADPFGGVIITDWYEDPKTPGERFKVNALILDKTLRADGVKLTVFKQLMSKGGWRDQKVDDKLARSLEDTILTRARQIKMAQMGK